MTDSARPSCKILIVDDEPFILSATARLLGNEGHSVNTCEQWAGVATAVRVDQPDLLLLDYNMPGIKGDDLCAILKRNSINPNMKIIMFSSEPAEFLENVVKACGADGYIKKDVALDILLARIEQVLRATSAVEV